MDRIAEISRFKAESELGDVYTIIEYQTYLDAGTEEIKGLKELQTTDGQAVNMVDNNTFLIVVTGEILKRI